MDLVGYVRVSTDEMAEKGVSLVNQPEKIRAYAALHEHRLVHLLVEDEGASGKTLDRPKLQEALEQLRAGAVEGLVVAKLDRLTRSLADWAYLIKTYFGERGGKKLLSVNDHIDTSTANGRLFLNFMVMVAEWERETIAERTRDALRGKIGRGERCGKVRFGFELDWTGPKNDRGLPVHLTENSAEQAVIREMCRLRHGEKLSFAAVARVLEEMGIETKEGARVWHPETVRTIVRRSETAWRERAQDMGAEPGQDRLTA